MRADAGRGRKAGRKKNKGLNRIKGPPEYCECPKCGHTVPHRRKLPCFQTKCPRCGSPMARQFSTGD